MISVVADGCSIPKLVSVSPFGDELADVAQAYAEHQPGQSISGLDGDLRNWLEVGL